MAIVFLVLVLSLSILESFQENVTLTQPTVLLISFDGFRWDYLQKTSTPNFDYIIKNGVQAPYTENVFPTKTLPNHYTLVTGLYAESHGIVGNNIYDEEKNIYFRKTENESFWWNNGEPIWVTNQNQGKRSAILFWPGSYYKIRGKQPDYFLPKSSIKNMSLRERIDKLVENLKGSNPPSFLGLYYNEPDHTGHSKGPDSSEVVEVIRRLDNATGYLFQKFRETGLLNQVNIIMTSDHGMTNVSEDKVIFVNDYVSPKLYKMVYRGAIGGLFPNKGQLDNVYDSLKNKHPNMAVYKREDIPKHFHYSRNKRIPPVFLIPDEGWRIFQNKSLPRRQVLGQHGYSNLYSSMHPFFLAHGPAFKNGYKATPFKSVDIYPLICKLLGIAPAPCNGSLARVKDMVKQGVFKTVEEDFTLIVVVGLITIITSMFMIYGIVKFCVRHRCPVARKYSHIYDLSSDYDL